MRVDRAMFYSGRFWSEGHCLPLFRAEHLCVVDQCTALLYRFGIMTCVRTGYITYLFSFLFCEVARREKAIQKLELELLTAQENHRRALDDVSNWIYF